MSAGTCETKPSPMDSIVKRDKASFIVMPFCMMPMAKPPMMLMSVIKIAAIASPRTNLLAPSIAP